jgi:hypothetical protein
MSSQVAEELDVVHRQAKQAYAARDLAAYMDVFAPALEYIQADGRTIDHGQLTGDVRSQMSRVRAMDTNYERQSLVADGDRATEELVQSAWADMTVFRVFKRRWQLRRTGRSHWLKPRMRGRILDVPDSAAPEHVRRAWVGLSLPIADRYPDPMSIPYYGVLTGPRTWFGHVWSSVTGRSPARRDCYIVPVNDALAELAKSAPAAADWWRDNTPHLIGAGRTFGFPVEFCQAEADAD